MKYILSLFLLLLLSAAVQAQEYSTTNKKAIRFFQDAYKYELDRDFDKAITLYERAIEADGGAFAEAHQRLGQLYGIIRDNKKSRMHFEKAVTLMPNDKTVMFSYIEMARLYLNESNYEQAQSFAKRFLSFNPQAQKSLYPQTEIAKTIIETSSFAIQGMRNPVEFSPAEMPSPVNKFTHQFFPVFTADQSSMIFTVYDEEKGEDMFYANFENGQWLEPKPIEELNSSFNEGTCSISADGRTMIFTSCEGSGNPRPIAGSCDLFISKKVGGKWGAPQNLGSAVNSRYWESQPALSADGKTLFFASDRPGGKGGRDIWLCRLDANGKWTLPVNLDASINTKGNEFSPFIHVNGQHLFFASDGHIGFGKLDLFRSDLDSLKKWTKAQNLGYPINNGGDQAALYITSDGQKGYYSDGILQDGKRVADKIFVFKIPIKASNSPLKIEKAPDVVRGVVYDAKTKKRIGTRIDLVDLATKQIVYNAESDSENGEYSIILNQGADYALYVNKEGYLFESLSFAYNAKKDPQTISLDIFLDPIEKGSTVTLNNIFFASGSFQLEEKSMTELEKLVRFMKENKNVNIEIGAHTDNVGSDEFNRTLSGNRAKSVVDYLKSQGLEESRIIAKGYGESQPVMSNDTDEGKAKNRRIEFKIL